MPFPGTQTALIKVAVIVIVAVTSHGEKSITTKAGCPERCGNVSIPFPFGMREGCYLNTNFSVDCNRIAEGETVALWMGSNLIIKGISVISGQLTMMQYIARDCYDRSGAHVEYNNPSITLPGFAAVSNAANKFFVVGCYTTGSVFGWRLDGRWLYYMSGSVFGCMCGSLYWDRKALEDEVLEYLRMKDIAFPDPSELLKAKNVVYSAYGEEPPKF
ncbi:hypothetical protein OROHE_008978 [Orobanche hederae]